MRSDGNRSSISDPLGKRKKSTIKAMIKEKFNRKSERINPVENQITKQIVNHPLQRE